MVMVISGIMPTGPQAFLGAFQRFHRALERIRLVTYINLYPLNSVQ
jgi:hypothetical protein